MVPHQLHVNLMFSFGIQGVKKMSSILSSPMNIESYEKNQELFDSAYELYQSDLKDRDNRPQLFGKFLYIDEVTAQQGKDRGFWHVASIGEDDAKFDMYPCVNHISHARCDFQCNPNHTANFLSNDNSIPCIYRAHKIIWIREIILLANINRKHPNLRVWKQKSKRGGDTRLLIRYLDSGVDFIIIFSVVYDNKKRDIRMYKLITAYPVVLKSYKRRFEKEYNESLKKK
jgi:hypothetical protein